MIIPYYFHFINADKKSFLIFMKNTLYIIMYISANIRKKSAFSAKSKIITGNTKERSESRFKGFSFAVSQSLGGKIKRIMFSFICLLLP